MEIRKHIFLSITIDAFVGGQYARLCVNSVHALHRLGIEGLDARDSKPSNPRGAETGSLFEPGFK